MSVNKKMIAATFLLIIWGVLVATGKSPASEYVTGLRDALIAFGVFTASMSAPNNPT